MSEREEKEEGGRVRVREEEVRNERVKGKKWEGDGEGGREKVAMVQSK